MRITILLFCLCYCFNGLAQDYKFGKVSKEELEEKFNPLDSSASATYLYKYRKSFFEYHSNDGGFVLITEVHERIKVYNKEGFEYATKEVRLHKSGNANEKFSGLKAYTYNLVNGKIEEEKLKKNGIFKTEVSKYTNSVKFTMPNIKEGSVVEYKYRVISPFIYNVDEFVFQEDIPINKLKARFEAPEFYNYKLNIKGYFAIRPVKERKWDNISIKDLEFENHISSYSLENIPALKEEPFVNNINNYRSGVKYELSFTKYPNSPIKYYSTTWEDVVKTIYKSSNFGTELNKSGYYDDDIDALVSGVSDPKRRIALIFNFVKSKVKWNKYYGKYTDKGVKKAYKDQVGNVAEINLMLTSMLRYVNLFANPVLVSTRGNGVPLFPTREGYDYVICSVKLDNSIILLDATSIYNSPNILPFNTLNWNGRVINKNGISSEISLYPKKKSANTVSLMVTLDENGDVEGVIRTNKTAHKALSYRKKYNGTDKEQFLETLENKYKGIEVSDFNVKNALDLSKPVVESYKFVKESQADIIGDKMYFSPLFFLRSLENPFKLEKREFPVDFGYPSGTKYMINIKIPEGYKVESLPENKVVSLPDNLGRFKYVLSANGNRIQLVVSTEINNPIIPALYYDVLKEYFKQMIEKENEQIVLTKNNEH